MKKLCAAVLAIALLIPLGGCWDHLEISDMLIVAGIGLDLTAGGQLYHATVEIVNVEAEGGQNIAAERVEGWGVTIHDAIQDATKMTGGVLFGNHCKVIVLGDTLARAGVAPALETVLRSPQYRKTVELLVARDATAAEILRGKTVNNEIISYELASIVKSNAENVRNTVLTGVYELHEAAAAPAVCSVIPAVTMRQNGDEAVLEVDGCGILSGDRLCGYLSGEESRLLSILLHGAAGATVTVPAPAPVPGPLRATLTAGRAVFRPALEGGKASVHVSLIAECSLRESVLGSLDLSDPAALAAVQAAVERGLARQLERLVTRVQTEYRADVFGFRLLFEESFRADWPELSQDWGEVFSKLAVTVTCETALTGSGLISNNSPQPGSDAGGNALP